MFINLWNFFRCFYCPAPSWWNKRLVGFPELVLVYPSHFPTWNVCPVEPDKHVMNLTCVRFMTVRTAQCLTEHETLHSGFTPWWISLPCFCSSDCLFCCTCSSFRPSCRSSGVSSVLPVVMNVFQSAPRSKATDDAKLGRHPFSPYSKSSSDVSDRKRDVALT